MASAPTLLQSIREGIIGAHHELDGPFGPRLVTYADYTASGRSLTFIEDFLREHVMPYYANTHTESSGTGLQTTRFREDARQIILRSLGGCDDDVIIFTGSGATGAIAKLIDIMNLRLPSELAAHHDLDRHIPADQRPVVFIGPYEHHSNEVPWRESIADVVVIDEDEDGRPDRRRLEEALLKHRERPLRIGSFSAASNVTGIGSGTREIASILHRHGALSFWDFAAAGPYVRIELGASAAGLDDHKDAVFLSPHKFIGGPGTPGILAVKRRLITNRVPTIPGGGTVAYVGPDEHRYVDDVTHREEGGTPEILGAIRAGLVFQLKDQVGVDSIRHIEDDFVRRAIARWRQHPNIRILGNPDAWRLSIVSFMIRYRDRYLHHNFVVSLLNDLFGIQARGGCSCAGPYGHRLLGIDIVRSHEYQGEVLRGSEGIKPGWARINFNYFITETAFRFILDAVEFVATEGWRFLPWYRFSPTTGLWDHHGWAHEARMSLHDIDYGPSGLVFPHSHSISSEAAYATYLAEARRFAPKIKAPVDLGPSNEWSAHFEQLRWFPMPHEAALELEANDELQA